MQQHVESAGFSVVEQFVGHGIGREMHEPPQVPNFCTAALLRKGDFSLRPGLVLAIEPMVNLGGKQVRCRDDHWTQVTADGQPSAHFEHTVAPHRRRTTAVDRSTRSGRGTAAVRPAAARPAAWNAGFEVARSTPIPTRSVSKGTRTLRSPSLTLRVRISRAFRTSEREIRKCALQG